MALLPMVLLKLLSLVLNHTSFTVIWGFSKLLPRVLTQEQCLNCSWIIREPISKMCPQHLLDPLYLSPGLLNVSERSQISPADECAKCHFYLPSLGSTGGRHSRGGWNGSWRSSSTECSSTPSYWIRVVGKRATKESGWLPSYWLGWGDHSSCHLLT